MLKVALLGSSGSLGARVYRRLLARGDIELMPVTRSVQADTGAIFWDFKSPLPEALRSADIVINCARSPDFSFNIRFNQLLYRNLPPAVRFINLSSNCIYARPSNRAEAFFFRGDAYIREKKAIEAMASGRPHSILLRPSVVRDEGGWKQFLSAVRSAERVVFPEDAETCRVRVIEAEDVAKAIENFLVASSSTGPVGEMATGRPLLDSFISKAPSYTGSTHTYYDSWLKNIFLISLNSWLLPDFFVLRVQSLLPLRRKQKNSELPAVTASLVVEGMTRLYLCGAHTR